MVCASVAEPWAVAGGADARVAGTLLPLALAALRRAPTERSDGDVRMLVNCFASVDVVERLSFKTVRAQLCRSCRHRRVHNGEVLFKQGQYAESCFIVMQGYVRVIVDGEIMAVLGPGDSFGQNGKQAPNRNHNPTQHSAAASALLPSSPPLLPSSPPLLP